CVVHRDVLFHIGELNLTFHLHDDRVGVRIPGRHDLATLGLLTFRHRDQGTVRHLVALALATQLIGNSQLGRTGHDHQAVLVLHVLDVMEANLAAMLDLDAGYRRGPRCRTTNVEGPHGQLGTRLTDGLGSNDAHRLTDVDLVATRQVTAVTLGAHTPTGFTDDRRTHHDLVNRHGLKLVDQYFVEQGTGFDEHLVGARLDQVAGNHTTEYTLAQRLNHVTAFDQRRHQQAFFGATIRIGNHQILGHVDQSTGQVTGVRRLQCGIRQTLTCTVGRDEVLQYVQALTEVRGNRRLDDRAVRLGHQAAHTGKLTNLRRRTPRTGVGHHPDGVERALLLVFAITILDHFGLQVFHHRLGDLVIGTRPDIDDLVVTLATGHQTGSKLLLDLAHFVFRLGDDFHLGGRNHHVLDAHGRARVGGFTETEVHQLVSEDTGVLGAEDAVALVEQARNRLLRHGLVDHFERQALRHDFPQLAATGSGISNEGALVLVAFLVTHHFVHTHLDTGMQVYLLVAQGTAYFLGIGKHHAFARRVNALTGDVVKTEYHVLCRHDDRFTVCRGQDVVGRHHQRTGFELGFQRQRYVYRHLVTVKVGVERRTHQRV